jgi:hypothetical protein
MKNIVRFAVIAALVMTGLVALGANYGVPVAIVAFLALNSLAQPGVLFGDALKLYNLAPSCLPRIAKVSSATGCTLTATSIRGLTPNEISNLGMKEIDLLRVIMGAAEAKALGVQESGLAMLLRSTIKDIKPALNNVKVGEQSMVLPYIMRPQKSVVNANYFTIEAGVVHPTAGAGGVPASAWNLTLNLGSSFLKSDIEAIERYFLPGNTIIVLTWDNTTNKNARTLVFTVHAAVNADAGGVKKATVTVIPNVSTSGWAGFNTGEKLVYQPTFGVAQTGANSIADREAWCYNQPTNISKKLLINWVQTTRTSRTVDSEYLKTLDAIMKGKVNDFQRGFVNLSLADQNKQMAMLEEDAFLKTAFYGQRINEFQSPETYDSLPIVYDRVDSACPKEYKANALGFFTLLTDCQRVVDLNGNALDLDYIFQQLYFLKRHRESDGDKVQIIDSMTDRLTANKIYDAMSKYYKSRYGVDTIRYAKIGEKITHDNMTLFNYNLYDIPEVGIQWAVFHDTFFDDQLSAFPATVSGVDFKARARCLWFIDFSDMKVGIAGTKSVKRKTPDPETNDLYKCVITADTQEINLRSTRWTAMIDRPQRHLIIQNFSDGCPTVAAAGCDAPNP